MWSKDWHELLQNLFPAFYRHIEAVEKPRHDTHWLLGERMRFFSFLIQSLPWQVETVPSISNFQQSVTLSSKPCLSLLLPTKRTSQIPWRVARDRTEVEVKRGYAARTFRLSRKGRLEWCDEPTYPETARPYRSGVTVVAPVPVLGKNRSFSREGT